MRKRLAATFGGVALGSALVTWIASASGSWILTLGIVLLLTGVGAAIGVVTGSRLTRSFRALVRRDRAVAVTASHELRTPITALRLSLEDLTLWEDTPPEVTAELQRSIHDLDRLTDAVTKLLDTHRDDHAQNAETVDVAELVRDAVGAWHPVMSSARSVVLDAPASVPVRLDRGPVVQALSVLLDQFGDAGEGDVTIDVARIGHTVRVRAADESRPRFATGVIHGSPSVKEADDSLTLSNGGTLAESLGGYLAVEDAPTTTLLLILPASGHG